jgi:DNA-binding NarL/FixJ family response regulator
VNITVVIAEDNLIVREGLHQILAHDGAMEVVATCADLPELMQAVERRPPDVVVTDMRMPPRHRDEGIEVSRWLRDAHPDTGVLVLSQYADPAFALLLLEPTSHGRGYLLKERVHDAAQLRAAVEAVAARGTVIDPGLVDALIADRARPEVSPLAELTAREQEVLAEIAKGASNAAIADSLVLTKSAVEKHINSIFIKLRLSDAADVSKRVKAALVFLADSGALTS